ncbi:hypothetical protein CBF35_01590 [Vagococcus salmoninarum]|uniref:Head-tail adaptor protein n=1 Tax=Vagococcus salmoninarum TaxID=2739 RepID=A0A429ZWB9_9ENTE|nr:head-tail adaptor protein [Vagococcus salmoninarum]RST98010.1 hypothetical protein CBF35_01590 [Vagococcus salmoninarum]
MALINNVSELNERIDILEIKPSGGFEPGEDEPIILHSCWAMIKTSMIKDIYVNNGTAYEGTTTFVIRSGQPIIITNKLKIRWKQQDYNIVTYNPDTSRKEFDVIIGKEYS